MRTHGTISCYIHGQCRCDECRIAAARFRRRQRLNRPDPEPKPDKNGRVYAPVVCPMCGHTFGRPGPHLAHCDGW